MSSSYTEALEALLGECQHESSGQFTVDIQAQARKLVEFQSSEAALFLLKGIQAANALRALRISVKLRRDEITLEFDPRKGLSQDFDVRSLFRTGQVFQPFHHLRPMLLAAVAFEPLEIRLRWADSGREQFWNWQDSRAEYRETGAPSFNLPQLRLELKLAAGSWWSRLRPSPVLAHIHSQLVRRCALCPIPVELDGRVINAPLLNKALKAGPWHAERSWLSPRGQAAFCLPSPLHGGAPRIIYNSVRVPGARGTPNSPLTLSWLDGPMKAGAYCESQVTGEAFAHPNFFQYPEGEIDWQTVIPLGQTVVGLGERKVPLLTHVRYLKGAEDCLQSVIPSGIWNLPSMRVGRWLGLTTGPGQLYYVQDGILLNPIDTSLHAHAILAAPEVLTDLGFLDPVRNDRLLEDLNWLRQEAAQIQSMLRN